MPVDPKAPEGSAVDETAKDPVVDLYEDDQPKEKQGLLSPEDEDAPNLVTILKKTKEGQDLLTQLGAYARRNFDNDWEATEENREQFGKDWKIFASLLPPKQFPFADAANMNLPVMFENLTRIVAQCFSELFGDWTRIYSVMSNGPDDDVEADILTKHGNWQFTEQITDFYRQAYRAMMMFFFRGDIVSHSYYDEFTRQNVHDVLTPDDFVAPYAHVTTKPDYSDLPHYTKVVRKYRHQLQALKKGGWEFVDEVLERKPAFDDEPHQPVAEAAADYNKSEIPTDSDGAPYKLLEHYCWTGLLKTSEDRDRFIKMTVDFETKNVLCLEIFEEPNWQDQRRYDMQLDESQKYQEAVKAHDGMIADLHMKSEQLKTYVEQANATGMPLDPLMIQQQAQQLNPQLYPPPPPKQWMIDPDSGQVNTEPEPPRKEAIHTFVHSVCIEPLVGNLGLGFGAMLADFNRATNTMLNQVVDSATLDNAGGMITAGDIFNKRPLERGPGKINIATVPAARLKDSIYEFQRKGANPQMFDLIDRVYRYAQSSSQAEDVLSGAPGKSGETRGGIALRAEQATKILSVPTRTFARTWLKPTIMNNARMNAIYLREEEIVMLNNDLIGLAPETLKLGRKMYERDYRVTFVADLRFATRDQRVREADEVTVMVAQPPNPQIPVNMPAYQRALIKSFEARGRSDMVPFMGPPLPPPQTPLGLPPPPPPGMMPVPPGVRPGSEAQQGAPGPSGNNHPPPAPGTTNGKPPSAPIAPPTPG